MALSQSSLCGVGIDDLLLSWPIRYVPRDAIADEAHHHAVEFKKQSGAAPEDIDDLMRRRANGLNLDKYFERALASMSRTRR